MSSMTPVASKIESLPRSSDRSFGLTFAGVFALVGLSCRRHGHGAAAIAAWSLAGLFLLVGLVRPTWLSLPNLAWARFGHVLSRVTNPIFLALVFFLFLTPIACLARILGKDPLNTRRRPDPKGSYWIPRNPPGPEPESLRNSF